PAYRERYDAYLKENFPKIPLPSDADTFRELAVLGQKLVALHLLETPELRRHGIAYPIGGDHLVKKMRLAQRYLPPTPNVHAGRVLLNDNEYFDNVPLAAWEFGVSGYQPAFKWLDDRVGRSLTEEDINHYRMMIASMRETAALLPSVDEAFKKTLKLDKL
ncbi:MAG: DNA methyltransferase, partial [Armatimonadetes bacterium]|nr:DNA methyltransferase [Armatimonadota bacterium]